VAGRRNRCAAAAALAAAALAVAGALAAAACGPALPAHSAKPSSVAALPGGGLLIRGARTCGASSAASCPPVRVNADGFTFQAPSAPPGAGRGGTAALVVTNSSAGALTVHVATTERADLVIRQGAATVYRWSQGRLFTPIGLDETWQPGQTASFALAVPPLPPGEYTAEFYFFGLPDGSRAPVVTTDWGVA
jgi:hypothetical protein